MSVGVRQGVAVVGWGQGGACTPAQAAAAARCSATDLAFCPLAPDDDEDEDDDDAAAAAALPLPPLPLMLRQFSFAHACV